MVWPELKERSARLREAVTLIRKLWSEERVTFEGEFYRTQNATIYDKPDEMVPIYLAAGGPLNAKYAGGRAMASSAPRQGRRTLCRPMLPNVDIGRAEF